MDNMEEIELKIPSEEE